jgi:tRNA pseudouridine38-40 synthase
MRLALVVEYEGTNYHGFQYQANAPSIQEELERAIASLTGEVMRVTAAGRTDAGVHARGQVVAFDTGSRYGTQTFVRALNHYLPDDIAVKAAYRTGADFDPRRMALSRRYRYTIFCGAERSPLMRRTAYYVSDSLNVRRMRKAAEGLVGRHDFARFASRLDRPGASTVRDIYEAAVRRNGDAINVEVEGSSFLPHQVRRMAAALVEIGRGRLTMADFRSMIDGRPGEGIDLSLPPQGLCLMKVTYPDFPPKAGESDDN